jgi:hypothetical protein
MGAGWLSAPMPATWPLEIRIIFGRLAEAEQAAKEEFM